MFDRISKAAATPAAGATPVRRAANAGPWRVAVIPHPNLDEKNQLYGDLLTLALAKREDLVALERAQLDAVLEELSLAAVFEAEAPTDRLEAVRLLDTDFLITLRPSTTQPETLRIDLIETRFGLRVMRSDLKPDFENPTAVDTFVQLLADCIDGIPERVELLIALPRFVDARLIRGDVDEALPDVLPQLVRQQMVQLPNAMEVSVDDAEALAQELALRGERQLGFDQAPAVIQGTLGSHAEIKEALNLQLAVERAGKRVAVREAEGLQVDELATWVQEATDDLLEELVERLFRRSSAFTFIVRGGTWHDPPQHVRSASRRLEHHAPLIGFRVVLDTRDAATK